MIGLLMLATLPQLASMSADKLARVCADESKVGQSVCETYISGVLDTSTWVGREGVPPKEWYCSAPETTTGEISRIVVIYLRQHPDLKDSPAPMVVLDALAMEFPCTR
jgi:hypothetical protein